MTLNTKHHEKRAKLISTFRINMDNILQWCNEVAFLHQDLYDDCTSLSKQIEQTLQLLLSSNTQEKQLDIVSSALNEISKDDQIYSNIKLKLGAQWEKIKDEKNFPISTIDEIFNDDKIIPQNKQNITDQDIKTTKDSIVQICSPFENDINSADQLFYDEFYTISNNLNSISKNTRSNHYSYNSKQKTPLFDKILKYFSSNISIFNLYVSINNQQKYLAKFREEIDKIAIEEAQENIPDPIIKPPTIENPLFNPYTSSPINGDITFKQSTPNSLRNSINSPFLMQKRSVTQVQSSQNNDFSIVSKLKSENDNLKSIIKQLQKEIEDYKDQLNASEMIINELASGNEDMQNTIDDLKERNEKLENENNDLRVLLDDLNK